MALSLVGRESVVWLLSTSDTSNITLPQESGVGGLQQVETGKEHTFNAKNCTTYSQEYNSFHSHCKGLHVSVVYN